MKIGSLFSGIGGFELAGAWCGHHTIWQSEIDPYCIALLAERFPGVPNLGDITRIDWRTVETPDIVVGGFPCQDISTAGKGAGLAGARSGLWYEYVRAIRDLGPRYIIVENVSALLFRGIDVVLGTLADLGYDAEWQMYGAADLGAPHRRHRLWLLAYPNRGNGQSERERGKRRPTPGNGATNVPGRGGETLAHPDRAGLGQGHEILARGFPEQLNRGGLVDAHGAQCERDRDHAFPSQPEHPGIGTSSWWQTEPDVGRVAYGVSAWAHRLRGLGNAIVPACAVPIFHRIADLEGVAP